MKPLRSLQGRLLTLVLAAVSAVWIAAAALTFVDARHELDELLDGHLAQAAALLIVQQTHAPEEEHGTADAPLLHRYAPRVAFQVWHGGVLVARSAQAPREPLGLGEAGFETRSIAGEPWRVFAARGGEGDVKVYVGERLGARGAILSAVMRSVLAPLVVALPLLAALTWWAVRRGLLPLRRLGEALGRRSPEATQPLVLADSADELQALVDALNSLFARIGRLIDAERRFTADAAHELRTPIAAIRAQAQVALAAEDDASRRHALAATLQGCDRLTRLVEQLLVLSRLDARPPADHQSVDLAALARRTVAELAPQALERRQTVALEAPPHCEVPADETLLAVLLRNLVDNAIRYSPAGAQVTLRLTAQDHRWHLAVDDSGPGLAPAELGRLGERFFRVLGSGESGSGLGWSIVRRIAEVLALRVEARRSTLLGGLCVEVEGALSDEWGRRR